MDYKSNYYLNKDDIDYSSVDIIEALNSNLNKDFNFYDVHWCFNDNSDRGGVHVALKAKSVHHATLLSPCILTASSIYEPSDIVILKVEPTPINNLPKEEKL